MFLADLRTRRLFSEPKLLTLAARKHIRTTSFVSCATVIEFRLV